MLKKIMFPPPPQISQYFFFFYITLSLHKYLSYRPLLLEPFVTNSTELLPLPIHKIKCHIKFLHTS